MNNRELGQAIKDARAEYECPFCGSHNDPAIVGRPCCDAAKRAGFKTLTIPLALPDLHPDDRAAVAAVLESGWWTSGPKVAEFEEAFAKACGEGCHAVAVSSATIGLTLAIKAVVKSKMGLGIVCPTWTFTATAEAIEAAGHRVIFRDVDEDTLNLPEGAYSLPRHDACVPVHIAGNRSYKSVLEGDSVVFPPVIEDAAHCLPYDPGLNTAVFSFYATKPIACGEGGMVVTRSLLAAQHIRSMRWHGMDAEVHDRHRTGYRAHQCVSQGHKANMTDIAAAIGIEQLKRSMVMRDHRIRLAARYRSYLGGCMFPPYSGDGSCHLFIVRVPNRDAFIEGMRERGVSCGVHYEPLHRHKYWREAYDLRPENFPIAEAARRHAVSLPLWSGMSEAQQDHVIKSANEVLA